MMRNTIKTKETTERPKKWIASMKRELAKI